MTKLRSLSHFFLAQQWLVVFAGLTYFLLAMGCTYLSSISIQTTIWLPNAVLLVFILRSNQEKAWYYLSVGFMANLAANAVMGAPASVLVGFSLANMLELIPAVLCYQMMMVHRYQLTQHLNKALALFSASVVLGCLLSAMLASVFIHELYGIAYLKAGFLWFSTDLFAMLAILPIALIASSAKLRSLIASPQIYEAQIREREEPLNITLHAMGEAVITLDANSKIHFMNSVAEEWLGYKMRDVLGLSMTDVCKFLSEKTGEPLSDPVSQCQTMGDKLYFKGEGVLVNCIGKLFNIQYSVAPLYTANREWIGCVMVLQDMTAYRKMQDELKHQASHDDLTGLMNRRAFEAVLAKHINDLKPSKAGHALCYLDLDRFKIVNDTAGHDAGDELLRQVSAIIKQSVRETDVVARLGGDEFALILPHCTMRAGYEVVQKMIASIRDYQFIWKDRQYSVAMSAGMLHFHPHAITQEEAMSQVDVACYAAKHQGGGTIAVYTDSGEASQFHAEIQFVSSIKQAMEQGRFRLFARETKPLMPSQDMRPSIEILLRMVDEKNNVLMPAQFLATAVRHGLMASIDEWVLNKVLIESGGDIAKRYGMGVSINLSANAIASPTFLACLKEALAHTPIPKHLIGFELSERAIVNDIDHAYELLNFLKSQQCYVSLDDFGTGMSSFNHLKHMPVRFIKIDGNLIRHIDKSKQDYAIVEAINQLAHKLNIKTIAEHVESDAIRTLVMKMGIDYAEGDAMGKAKPFTEMLDQYPVHITHI